VVEGALHLDAVARHCLLFQAQEVGARWRHRIKRLQARDLAAGGREVLQPVLRRAVFGFGLDQGRLAQPLDEGLVVGIARTASRTEEGFVCRSLAVARRLRRQCLRAAAGRPSLSLQIDARRVNFGDPRNMFSHIMIGTSDLERAKTFYDAVLGTLGVPAGAVDRHRIFWRTPSGVFSVTLPIDGKPATVGNGGTIGFACQSAEQADAWHAAGLANGGLACEDPPGVREGPTRLYLAYLRDPDGNKICALCRMPRA